MRRMSANNHRGQEVKIFHKQAGYMRAMIFSHINDQMSCKRSGSIYVYTACPEIGCPVASAQISNRDSLSYPSFASFVVNCLKNAG